MEGIATYSGTTLTINVDKTNGSGTIASWNLNVVGEPGAGDLSSANNLSDVTNKKAAKDNISVHGADVASASTIDLEAATGDLVDVTGTTTITAITLSEGHERTVRFTGALTLTHGASLVLPGAANITTVAGAFAVFRGYASGVVRCVGYTPAGGNLGVDPQSLTATQKAQARANAGVLGRSRVINGQFVINQRGAATVADNAYGWDRFRVLGEFATATIYADSFNAAGGDVYGGALQFTGTTDKGGIFQVIEGHNCKDLRGKTVTLSMRLVVNNARLGNMKIGILEWTGTEDATTGDPVSSWGADGVTPTLATNWAFKNTPTNLNVTTSSAIYSTTVTLGSTFTNLAVMIWNDDKSYTAADNFGITNVQLEEGGVVTPYDQRMYGQEYSLCLPYYWRIGQGVTATSFGMGYCPATTQFRFCMQYPALMRGVPQITSTAGSTFEVVNLPAGVFTGSALTAVTVGRATADMSLSISGATAGWGGWIRDVAGTAWIAANAEI
jgi:hypothetical protein